MINLPTSTRSFQRKLESDVKIKPTNRYFLVEPLSNEEEQEECSILLPEGYRQASPYGVARILACPSEYKIDVKEGDRIYYIFLLSMDPNLIVYNNSMLENIPLNGKTFSLLLENYIQCIIEAE